MKKPEEKETLKANYNLVFATPEGKKVLADINRFCKFGQDVFVPEQATNAHRQGVQKVSIYINNKLEK
jgi:hypothetical protein